MANSILSEPYAEHRSSVNLAAPQPTSLKSTLKLSPVLFGFLNDHV